MTRRPGSIQADKRLDLQDGLALRFHAAFMTRVNARACSECGRGELPLASVALVHFVPDRLRGEIPAHLVIWQDLSDLHELAGICVSEAAHHAACFKTVQQYAVILYAKDESVLHQLRFTMGESKL